MKPRSSYTIWFSQRTGSTLLCKALESTGIVQESRANGSTANLTCWHSFINPHMLTFKSICGNLEAQRMVYSGLTTPTTNHISVN